MTTPMQLLPTHPFTGLRAIGVLPSGRPVWPVMGGNGEGGGDGGGTGSGSGGSGGSGGAGDGGGSGGNDGGGNSGRQEQTFTQADLDRIVGERLARERTSKYGDYDQLKAKATELDQLKESTATEQEKAITAAKKDAEASVRGQLEPQMVRLQAALEHGLPEELGKRILSAARRLVGTTAEELAADAAEFFKTSPLQINQGGGDGFDQGPRGRGDAKPTVASGAELYNQRRGKTK